jgi:hypothetical protein
MFINEYKHVQIKLNFTVEGENRFIRTVMFSLSLSICFLTVEIVLYNNVMAHPIMHIYNERTWLHIYNIHPSAQQGTIIMWNSASGYIQCSV